MGKKRPCLAAAMAGTWMLLAYHDTLRPWIYSWGATATEINDRLPGDDLVVPGKLCTTRAITVRTEPRKVWPWLAQLGENRGGFYSYSWLERACGADVHNAFFVHSEWQDLERGDTVWLAHRYGSGASQVVAKIEPNSHLILVSQRDYKRIERGKLALASWGFHLVQRGCDTRLLVRTTGGWVGNPVFDLVHFVMERKMLFGIAHRAESVVQMSESAASSGELTS